jgi:hypothetical protein
MTVQPNYERDDSSHAQKRYKTTQALAKNADSLQTQERIQQYLKQRKAFTKAKAITKGGMSETGQAKSSSNLVKARRRSTGENNGLTVITNDKNGGEPKEEADELAQIKLAFSSTPALSSAFANSRKRRTMTATQRSPLNRPSDDPALTRFTNNDNLNVTSAEDFLGD